MENINSWSIGKDKIEKEINLHSTMDASIWTKEFMKIFKDMYKIDIDEEWIYGWFANAIMCGYDHMAWKRDKEYIYILQSNSGAIIKVFHWEPSIKDMAKAYATYLNCDDDAICKGSIEVNTTLYRWAKDKGLMVWDGKKEVDDSRYNWKVEK